MERNVLAIPLYAVASFHTQGVAVALVRSRGYIRQSGKKINPNGLERMQPRFETPPKITISVTNTCNLECKHCYGGCTGRPSANEFSTHEWIAFFDYLYDNDFIQVYFEGGEPFHRVDFKELLQSCSRRFMTWVRTNGTLITPETARELRQMGVGRVLVDIMGAERRTHEWFTGQRGSFEKSCAAVRYLVEAGITTYLLIILTRKNVAELQSYLDMAHSLGATKVGILRLYPLGRAKQRWDELSLSIHEQMAGLERLEPPDGLNIMQSWHPKNHNCCWQSAAVNAFGDSIGCMYLREYVNYGNIREMPFLDTWHNDPHYKQLRSGRVEKSCGSCTKTQGTRGGCRSTAFAFHGRWDAPDPFCSSLNRETNLRVLPQRLLQKSVGP